MGEQCEMCRVATVIDMTCRVAPPMLRAVLAVGFVGVGWVAGR